MQTEAPPITHAEPCRTVQKEEWVNTILLEVTANPKITNNELAEKYQVPRNRISKYRNIIRNRQRVTNFETLNKIDSILEDRLIDMETRDLIALRRQLTPEELNVKQTVKHISLEWKLESNTPTKNTVQPTP
jgi:hypothetical protein